jgi:cyclomaltodextrinase / maltogenic alpha-amylase / neopullulanase
VRFSDAILWHVYPLGFVGAEGTAEQEVRHRLPQLTGWLDYVLELGTNVLQLGPVFASETHGYDTVDHFRVDPRLGDDGDFDMLVAAARDRGIRLVLDGVFNHVGRSFPRFQEAAADPGSPAARWFRRQGDGWATFEGHDALVTLNHDEPEVRDHVVTVMRHWLDRGVAGWRLDAAYAVPTAFWRAVSDAVHETHPDAWLLGEVLHGDYAAFVGDSGLDSVTQYELWKAVWSGLNDRNLFELAHALKRHATMVDSFVPTTFLGNHDTTRIASRLDEPWLLEHAVTVLLTVPGHPAVYAGDEQAFTGVKEERSGGDDAVRPAFPATPDELSRLGEPTLRLHQRLIGLRRRHPWLVNGVLTVERLENELLVYRVANRGAADQALTVVLNLTGEPAEVGVPPGQQLLEGGLGPRRAAVIGA